MLALTNDTDNQSESVNNIVALIRSNIRPSDEDLQCGYEPLLVNFCTVNSVVFNDNFTPYFKSVFRLRKSYLIPANTDPRIVSKTAPYWDFVLFLNVLASLIGFDFHNRSQKDWLKAIVSNYSKQYMLDRMSTEELFSTITGYTPMSGVIDIHSIIFQALFEYDLERFNVAFRQYVIQYKSQNSEHLNVTKYGIYESSNSIYISDKFVFRFLKKHSLNMGTDAFKAMLLNPGCFDACDASCLPGENRKALGKTATYRVSQAPVVLL